MIFSSFLKWFSILEIMWLKTVGERPALVLVDYSSLQQKRADELKHQQCSSASAKKRVAPALFDPV